MTERQAMTPFESRLAERTRAYTNHATERHIDALAIARTAMSRRPTTRRSQDASRSGLLGRRFADARWAAALLAVVLVAVVGVAVVGRLSGFGVAARPTPAPAPTPEVTPTPGPTASAGGPIPDVLRHSWARPAAVTPGGDRWGSGFLSLSSDPIAFGPQPGAGASKSAIVAGGPDSIIVTATLETQGCAVGDVGTYHWTVEGKGTVLTLAPIGADACRARETALAGGWVRSDLPLSGGGGTPLAPGVHATSIFDPLGDPAAPIRLSYTVAGEWHVLDDSPTTMLLHHAPDASQGQPSADYLMALMAQPRLAAEPRAGVECGLVGAAPGVGGGIDALVAAITAGPGVVSTPPVAITVGGYQGLMLDLQLADSWTAGCEAPDGPIAWVPILVDTGSSPGPTVGIGRDRPMRIILLDLMDGRTMAVIISDGGPTLPSVFQAHVTEAMPVVESFEFHAPAP